MEHNKEGFFHADDEVMLRIRQVGVTNYMGKLHNLAQAFRPGDRAVRCIDERTPGGLHMAGSGILLGLDKALEVVRSMCVSEITSHPECGAGALAFGKLTDAEKLKYGNADHYARVFAEELARKAGLPCRVENLSGPSGQHIARVVYYDGTGSFNCNRVSGLPRGFVVSRRFLDAGYAGEEAEIAVQIALGGHGYGELITKDAPLIIIPIGDPRDASFSAAKLEKEVAGIASANAGKVVVDSFEPKLKLFTF